ncbi:hypothetical protein MK852_00745 [Shewanella benthica]|nr:hypothetical protein [Shewanella benthica]
MKMVTVAQGCLPIVFPVFLSIVFPACLLDGIHCLELKDKSWIPEQVRVDNCSQHDRHFRPDP